MTGHRSEKDRWELVKELLDRALDLPPDEREAFLREVSRTDATLHAEVSALVAAAEPEVDPLEQPAAASIEIPVGYGESEFSGLMDTQVGPYRLTRELGRGGMGVVYEAQRTGEVAGIVAVKVIKRGMDSDAIERRFRQERQILARLAHPNIVHFLDGGVLPDGRPFFVMEKVEGVPITRYCDEHGLDVEARIRLFLQVLEAVETAHRHLVVHRDLKPSNLLVRADGVVKLLDFGVAKVLGGDDAPDATLTRLGARVLTPSYSSPEQVRGEPVTTAADIYSLGVVLYELLTGRPPFLLDTAPLLEVHRVVSFQEPTRPSQAATGRVRIGGGSSPRVGRQLAGDLDAVILRALRKEPEKRYGTVSDFNEDLCRFLDRRPVLARQGTLGYRAERFIRRHRGGVLVGAVASVVLLGAGWMIWDQASRARQQARLATQRVQDVRSLLNSMVFDVHDAVAALPGSTGVRKLILDRAYDHLDAVRGGVPEDPELLMELSDVYRRLGEVQGRTTAANLGDLAAARVSFQEGLALAERAVAANPTDLGHLRRVGLLHERLAGTLASGGEIREGVDHSTRALEIYERIAATHPDSARHQLTVAIGLINLADLQGHPNFPNLGRPEEAEEGYRRAGERLNAEPLASDGSLMVRRYRGLVAERLARIQRLTGDLDGALGSYQASLEVREALFRDLPSDDDVWRDVGVAHQNLCVVAYAMARYDEALERCDVAHDVYARRFQADTLNAQTLSDLASAHQAYEELFLAAGDTARALRHLEERLGWTDRLLLLDASALAPRLDRLDALLTRGLILAGPSGGEQGVEAAFTLASGLEEEGHLSVRDAGRVETLRRLVEGNGTPPRS